MSSLLALETSTNACSAALQVGDKVYDRFVVAPREHSDRILAVVTELLAEADLALAELDGIAFGKGPGSFLGTRIAAGVAQGLGFALNVPLLPVSSLQALAQQAVEQFQAEVIMPAWDARMQAFYWGHYALQEGGLQPQHADALSAPLDFAQLADKAVLIGNAWQVYYAAFPGSVQAVIDQQQPALFDCYPQARHLLPQAQRLLEAKAGVDAEQATPIYLRDPV